MECRRHGVQVRLVRQVSHSARWAANLGANAAPRHPLSHPTAAARAHQLRKMTPRYHAHTAGVLSQLVFLLMFT